MTDDPLLVGHALAVAVVVLLIVLVLLLPAKYDPAIRLREWLDRKD